MNRKEPGAVLGIWDGHDASVAIVDRGSLVFALSEERPSRRKRYSGFPELSLALALDWADRQGISISDVAVAGASGRLPLRVMEPLYETSNPHRDPLSTTSRLVAGWENRVARTPGVGTVEGALGLFLIKRRLERRLSNPFRIHGVPHHEAHAGSALFGPRSDNALIVTWDAYGEGVSGTIRTRTAPEKVLAAWPTTFGLATLYGAVTLALGFMEGDEGKVMGLAARGDPRRLQPRFAGMFDDRGRLRMTLTQSRVRALVTGQSREDVAAALQATTEDVILRTLSPYLSAENPRPLLLAGGLFANIRVNGALMTHPGVAGGFVFPNMGDGGLSAGAAQIVFNRLTNHPATSPGHWFLGPGVSAESLIRAAESSGRPWRKVADPAEAIAGRIASGQVVCRYCGRDEFGPRALGNRSILFSATTPGLGERVNRALDRDDFMPFGPAVSASATDLWSDPGAGTDLSTMTVAVPARSTFSAMCPGAVHIDGTTRPQVVDDSNPGFFAILEAYRQETGIPAVINTSFNLHGEPVVHTPSQAVETFLRSGLDALYLNDLEVEGGNADS